MTTEPEAYSLPPEILEFYASAEIEHGRLFGGNGPLELARTRQIVSRYLKEPGLIVRDIGGGTGVYAYWLAGLGHEVHLLDAVPSHIDHAIRELPQGIRLASAVVGDARQLPWADESSDLVLMFGPLYHLTELHDRQRALDEAFRVLRPGGIVLGAAISRLVTTMNALFQTLGTSPAFYAMAKLDADTGRHTSPPESPNFTTAWFHDPAEFAAEFRSSKFELVDLLGVEGPGWLVPDFRTAWADPVRRFQLLETAERLERREDVLGMNKHIIAVGHKPGQ